MILADLTMCNVGLFLPAFVRPMLDSWETAEKVPPPPLNDVCGFLCFWVVSCSAFKLDKQLTLFLCIFLSMTMFIFHNPILNKQTYSSLITKFPNLAKKCQTMSYEYITASS